MIQRAPTTTGRETPPQPVELLSREPSGPLSNVLVPTDLSDGAERAVRWALEHSTSRTNTIRVLMMCEGRDCDAADLVRFMARFGEQPRALMHGQIFTQSEEQLYEMIRAEGIQKIVVGVGDDASPDSDALAQRLARLGPCGVVVVPRRQPARELVRLGAVPRGVQ